MLPHSGPCACSSSRALTMALAGPRPGPWLACRGSRAAPCRSREQGEGQGLLASSHGQKIECNEAEQALWGSLAAAPASVAPAPRQATRHHLFTQVPAHPFSPARIMPHAQGRLISQKSHALCREKATFAGPRM